MMFDKGIDLSQATQLAQPVTPTIKVAVLPRVVGPNPRGAKLEKSYVGVELSHCEVNTMSTTSPLEG